jgi:hypothetical protein
MWLVVADARRASEGRKRKSMIHFLALSGIAPIGCKLPTPQFFELPRMIEFQLLLAAIAATTTTINEKG